MGKSRSSDLVNIMVGDMTCDCWCTTQSSLLRENPWGNGRRYGVVIVRCVVEFVTLLLSIICHLSVDRVENSGDFDVVYMVCGCGLLSLSSL